MEPREGVDKKCVDSLLNRAFTPKTYRSSRSRPFMKDICPHSGQNGASIHNENEQRLAPLGPARSVIANAYRPPSAAMAIGIPRGVSILQTGRHRSCGERLLPQPVAQEHEDYAGKGP